MIEELGSEIRSNITDVIEYRNQISRIYLEGVTQSADNAVSQLSNATSILERDLETLFKGFIIW